MPWTKRGEFRTGVGDVVSEALRSPSPVSGRGIMARAIGSFTAPRLPPIARPRGSSRYHTGRSAVPWPAHDAGSAHASWNSFQGNGLIVRTSIV